MGTATYKRGQKQFKVLVWTGIFVYPVWLFYGVWTKSYDVPISVGFVTLWANWSIRKVRVDAETANASRVIDWQRDSIDKYLNIKVFLVSLIGTMLLFLLTLKVLRLIIT